jgi:hypothetical protein
MAVDFEQIVNKLARDTHADKIKWSVVGPDEIVRSKVIGFIYEARVQGKTIVVYEYSFTISDEFENQEQRREVAIEFVIGENYILELRFPQAEARWDLLSAIRAKASDIDTFAAEFLRKE